MLNFIPKKDKTREEVYEWVMDPANEYVREALWQRLSQEQKDHLMNEMKKEVVRRKAFNAVKEVAIFAGIMAVIVSLAILSAVISSED